MKTRLLTKKELEKRSDKVASEIERAVIRILYKNGATCISADTLKKAFAQIIVASLKSDYHEGLSTEDYTGNKPKYVIGLDSILMDEIQDEASYLDILTAGDNFDMKKGSKK